MLNLKNLTLIVLSNQKLLKIVDDLFLDVGQGEAIGICGESGCGKSSLASGLLGISPEPGVVTGAIEIGGVDLLDGIDQNVRLEAAKHRIRVNRAWAKGLEKRMAMMRGKVFGLLPQGSKTALSPFLTITEQLHKAYQKSGRPVGGAEPLICDILCRLRLKPLADKHPHQLSGGEAQRVLIGQMIALNPEIAIFDEPTTGLDITLQVEIIDLIRDFKHGTLPGQDSKQRTVIVVSHDLRLIRQVAERVAVMYAGEMVEVGRCETIFTGGAAHPYTKKLIEAAQFRRSFPLPVIPGELPPLLQPPRGCKFYERCDQREASCQAEKPPMSDLGDGHWVRCPLWNRPPKPEGSHSEPILLLPRHRAGKLPLMKLRHLSFSFSPSFFWARLSRDRREPFALRGIDLEVYENESIALVGESACGKTTLGKVITGQLRPERGLVCWQGAPLQYTSVAIQQHRKRVQMIWQNPDASLNPGMKVSQLIQETILLRRGERLSSKNRASVEGEMRNDLARVKLLGKEDCYPETLSGGEQRRLSIARCLALEPKLIVADEPFSGLDASLANLLKNIFMGERVSGVTFVFILHDLKSAQQLCDRVAVITDGRIVETDDIDRIFDDSLEHHPYTQTLLEASHTLSS